VQLAGAMLALRKKGLFEKCFKAKYRAFELFGEEKNNENEIFI